MIFPTLTAALRWIKISKVNNIIDFEKILCLLSLIKLYYFQSWIVNWRNQMFKYLDNWILLNDNSNCKLYEAERYLLYMQLWSTQYIKLLSNRLVIELKKQLLPSRCLVQVNDKLTQWALWRYQWCFFPSRFESQEYCWSHCRHLMPISDRFCWRSS